MYNFIGTYQNDYYGYDPTTGRLITHDLNDQVNWNPPADGQIIEAKFPLINTTNSHNPLSQSLNPLSQPSLYVGVDHNMNHVIKGGAFAVVATNTGPWPWPSGTWVPPKGSTCVTSNQNGLCPLAAVTNATK